jgi:hypothetical protein
MDGQGPTRHGEMVESPTAAHPAQPLLRPFLRCGYAGWARPPERACRFVLPASTCVHLVLRIEDSVQPPSEFVNGVQGTFRIVDGRLGEIVRETRREPPPVRPRCACGIVRACWNAWPRFVASTPTTSGS